MSELEFKLLGFNVGGKSSLASEEWKRQCVFQPCATAQKPNSPRLRAMPFIRKCRNGWRIRGIPSLRPAVPKRRAGYLGRPEARFPPPARARCPWRKAERQWRRRGIPLAPGRRPHFFFWPPAFESCLQYIFSCLMQRHKPHERGRLAGFFLPLVLDRYCALPPPRLIDAMTPVAPCLAYTGS
jgi:hypothetical protein